MSDVYKLQYNGMTLAYPGWNGYVGWENAAIPFQRYEKTLFKSSNGCGVSAGTFSDDLRDFDEIGLGLTWQDGREVYGRNWIFLAKQAFSAETGSVPVVYHMSNDWNYYTFENLFNFDNTAKTFTIPNNQSTQYWGIYTSINTTATLLAANNGSRHKIIGEIIGVKYQ
jgi:hypothetical protein